MNQVELAQRIKELRLERRMTLDDAAAKVGLTRSWWSKVENFRLTPSLPALFRISSALGVTISKLLEGLDERPKLVVVRPDQREPLSRDPEQSTIRYESLAHGRPNRRMDPMLLSIEPGKGRTTALPHEGEEFLIVLRGRVKFEYGVEERELSAGDAAYFDGLVPHRLFNPFDESAEVLCVFEGLEASQSTAE